jgi:GT2 family glycosyltransferase/spore maturation protein CgeB
VSASEENGPPGPGAEGRDTDELGSLDRAGLERRVSELEREAARLRREAAASYGDVERARRLAAQRGREADQALSSAAVGLRGLREDLERVGASAAWRVGHGITRAGRRLRRSRTTTPGAVAAAIERVDLLLERLQPRTSAPRAAPDPGRPPPAGTGVDEAVRDRLAERLRDRLGPVAERESWPSVSALVVNRDGELLLPRLLTGLAATDYPELELIIVDNASTDGSAEVPQRFSLPFPVRVVRNDENRSFADANNQAAELARHPLLLLLNNDIQPFEPGWLKELVDALLASEAGAMGATLLRTEAADDIVPSGFSVQHRGIYLERSHGLPRPRNLDDGADLFDARFGTETPCLAATAACLLVSQETFDRAGGLDPMYRYGLEDVELGFAINGLGRRVACAGRSVLFHDEGVTQHAQGREFRRLNRQVNHRRLAERWGPAMRREVRLGLLLGDPTAVGDQTLHVGIARTSNDPAAGWGDHYTGQELGDALQRLGWRVSYLAGDERGPSEAPSGLDVVVALTDRFDPRDLPSHVTAVAWIRNWTDRWVARPWLDRYDILLASSRRSRELVHERVGRMPEAFPLATNPGRFSPRARVEALASDYVFTGNRWGEAREVESALQPRAGERVAVYGRGWERHAALGDYARGTADYEQLPDIYASSQVVVDDTAEPALAYDAVNSRVFDALATETPVITNCVQGARELFDEDFPVWTDPASLRAGLDELLQETERRAELAHRYRAAVLAEHTYDHRARELRRLLLAGDERWSVCLKIGAPDWEQAERWGDLYLARDLARALKRLGHRCSIQVLAEWDDEEGLGHDVAVHLRGRSSYTPRPGQVNVLWLISHPADITAEECEGYDLVCVASASFAETLRTRTSVPVAVLEQGTDPWRFRPDPVPDLTHDLVFVGNSRGVRRRILDDLLPTDHDLAVWGGGWEGILPGKHLRGAWIANDDLRRTYSSARLVLCDHWEDMRANGFVSNRIYDAVACGALVICDRQPGLGEVFGDAVVTYETEHELRELVDRLLASPEERERRVAGGRERVVGAHTMDHRAAQLMHLVAARGADTGHRSRIATPL